MCMELTQVKIQKAKVKKKSFLPEQMIPSSGTEMWVTFTSVQYSNTARRCLVGRDIT